MLARIADKWTLLVVRVLGRGPCRFNALRREVGEISQKVLASTLRDLEENGFVSRKVTPTKPPQVEYALTAMGREFLAPVRTLSEWVIENVERIETARLKYAAKAWTATRAKPAAERAKPAAGRVEPAAGRPRAAAQRPRARPDR